MDRKNVNEAVTTEQVEYGLDLMIDFDKLQKVATAGKPVVPVAVQDVETKEVLIVAYANDEALKYTLENKIAAFWSTSRDVLWVKGLTSGDQLEVVDVRVNCDQNSLLYIVKMVGKGSCHTKRADGSTRFGCYYRRVHDGKLEMVREDY